MFDEAAPLSVNSNDTAVLRPGKVCSKNDCHRAGEIQPLSAFHKSTRDGFRGDCKVCANRANRAYSAQEHVKAYTKVWHAQSYAKDIEASRARIRARYHATKDTAHARMRLLVRTAKKRAKKYGLLYTLDTAWADAHEDVLCDSGCPLCGILFSPASPTLGRVSNPNAPSLDQIAPRNGYTPENTQIICDGCNRAKNADTLEEFIARCHRVAKRHPLLTPPCNGVT